MRKIIFQACFFLISSTTYCQIPSNEGTWILKKQDDFNSINTNDWHQLYHGGNCRNSTGLEMVSANNSYIFNGNLRLEAQKSSTPWSCFQGGTTTYHNYRCGVLYSKFLFKYGFWEISAKLPQGYGFWPAFWLWKAGNCSFYNEIDILERFGGDILQEYSSIYHWATYDFLCNEYRADYGEEITGLSDLSNSHKYAVEWSPERMIFYFDDEPVKVFYDPVFTPKNAMETILNIAIDSYNPPNGSTVFPAYYDIDYLKIYQLNTACSTVESICTFNPTTYNYALKKSISIAGGSCTSNINTSSNVALRATDYVLLGDGTTITANGSGYFLADVIPCTD
jgi:beta-glucanase (GH16 family)